ncbi:MAG: hypothetical protein A07HN63_00615 [uncultured archaeon A07HN63]|nr:MAG: hypothetical protein A07HN63_00615 [uncultured archaeon A07HN63]
MYSLCDFCSNTDNFQRTIIRHHVAVCPQPPVTGIIGKTELCVKLTTIVDSRLNSVFNGISIARFYLSRYGSISLDL